MIDAFKRELELTLEVMEMNKVPCPFCGQKKLDGHKISNRGEGNMLPYHAKFKVYCTECGAEKVIVGDCLGEVLTKFSSMKKKEEEE